MVVGVLGPDGVRGPSALGGDWVGVLLFSYARPERLKSRTLFGRARAAEPTSREVDVAKAGMDRKWQEWVV